VAAGTEFNVAIQKILEEIITVHGSSVFNGDGYSQDWQLEAASRGLPNLRTTLDALPELISEPSMALFSKYGVFSHREMHSRYEIGLEQYALSIHVEASLALEIGSTVVLPAAVRYQTEIALNIGSLKAAGVEADLGPLEDITTPLTELRTALGVLRLALQHDGDTPLAEAEHAMTDLLPAMNAVRVAADLLERVVADDLWPLPTYQEMLFIL
ncbi:MAG: glnA, partial [Pseudonocardiales bacterium]|nr:glnA [Pseudonocardiales bacterium]